MSESNDSPVTSIKDVTSFSEVIPEKKTLSQHYEQTTNVSYLTVLSYTVSLGNLYNSEKLSKIYNLLKKKYAKYCCFTFFDY